MDARAEDLRHDIADERRELAQSIQAIGDRVSPSRIVERRTNRVRARLHAVRTAVMGDRPGGGAGSADLARSAQRATRAAGDQMASTAHDVVGAVAAAPDHVAETTRGNPLAAGLVAFGVGLVAAAVLPPTRREERLGARAADLVEPAVAEIKALGHEVVADLRPAAAEATEHVKEAAVEGVAAVKERSAAGMQAVASATTEAAEETAAGARGGPSD